MELQNLNTGLVNSAQPQKPLRHRAGDLTANQVIEAIRRKGMALERTPKFSDFNNGERKIAAAATYIFGTWNRAVVAAGYEPHKIFSDNLKARAIEAIKHVSVILGGRPSAIDFDRFRKKLGKKKEWPASQTINKRFGGWLKAIGEAGLSDVPLASRKKISLPDLTGRKVVFSRELPKNIPHESLSELSIVKSTVTKKYLRNLIIADEKGYPHIKGKERGREFTLRVVAGETYTQIGNSVGLSKERVRQLVTGYTSAVVNGKKSKEEIAVTALIEASQHLNKKSFSMNEYNDYRRGKYPSYPSASTITVLLGSSWKATLCKVLIDSKVSQDEALWSLKMAAITMGKTPTKKEYVELQQANKNWLSVDTICCLFGSWRQAIYALLQN